MYDPNNIAIPLEEQTPERYVLALKEAQRHAKRMRAELNKALGSLDELDRIVEIASETTLFEEDYLDYAREAGDDLWGAIEATNNARSQGDEAYKHIFSVLRVFMARRWKAIRLEREAREAEQKAKRKTKNHK